MGELRDRRAQKKAQTREHVRTVAQRMFAEGGFDAVTIADVAREADVAVQTVFNHFATKEELFFDGRLPWVDAPAEAVRTRAEGVSPLTALRRHLVAGAGHFVALQLSEETASFTAALAACPDLAAYEQRVLYEAELRLGACLAEAWATDPEPGAGRGLAPEIAAPLTAAMWLTASRVVLVEQRRLAAHRGDAAAVAAEVERLLDQVLATMQARFGTPLEAGRRADTGWPPVDMRRAG
ncbi:TetR/AcrR family transcriptional regulator [Blastococcus litoris]|uniref:TetR/AcrR family transcriptional regulator n=1 Tax=Blastococcus litoris TaxID=2171622 RepID=UPI0019D2B37A|nr:TetR/AcrR family transcriptional regulator [Blastococcus litoris]